MCLFLQYYVYVCILPQIIYHVNTIIKEAD